MADIKFSELSTLAAADVASADVLAVVDTSATASKKLTINNLFGAVPVNIAVVDTTASSSNTTGSITTTGGVGVSGSVVVGTDLTIHGDADIDGTTNLDIVDIDGAVQIDAAVTVGVDDTGHDVKFFGATTGQFLLWDQSADELALVGDTKLSFHDAAGAENIVASADGHLEINAGTTLDITAPTVDINVGTTLNVDGVTQITGAVTIGVDDTGHDVQIFGATADSNILWDESDNALEFGNSFLTITDARTTGTMDVRGLTIDVSNKVDTGSSNDRIGIDVDVIGDVSGNTIRDAVAIRAVSRQSTGAEVTRLNTPIHAVLDLANTTSANNVGTTLSGAYGLVIDHDDTIATRTGQPTAFISFGELYAGGSTTVETSCLFDIFPEGKNGDATFNTAANVAFYTDGAQYSTTRDVMILCSTDGAPGTDAYDKVLMEPDVNKDIILLDEVILSGGYIAFERGHLVLDEEEGLFIQTEDYTSEVEAGFLLNEENDSAIMLEESSSSNRSGSSNFIMFETGSQDADGVLKIKVNGEYKYLQLYNEPGTGVATEASGGY